MLLVTCASNARMVCFGACHARDQGSALSVGRATTSTGDTASRAITRARHAIIRIHASNAARITAEMPVVPA